MVSNNPVRRQRFWLGFGLIVGAAAVFNVLSVYHAWFPGCADCVVWGGVPFPFISHGGFFTEAFVRWAGIRDNAVAIGTVAVLGGFVAMRVLRGSE
jgi:hypothetical protein